MTGGAHPRSRGENKHRAYYEGRQTGSSPLTRGKLASGPRSSQGRRLIPAHAGKTASERPNQPRSRAHPRSRGENSRLRPGLRRRPGSSPLTRGKPMPRRLAGHLTGLIPAHAGKTERCPGGRARAWAHPRSRGENFDHEDVRGVGAGSSPLTRGKPRPHVLRGQPDWAHPRSRGENTRSARPPSTSPGSSPLTRGKPRAAGRARPRRRLIPAHAGKTRLCRP